MKKTIIAIATALMALSPIPAAAATLAEKVEAIAAYQKFQPVSDLMEMKVDSSKGEIEVYASIVKKKYDSIDILYKVKEEGDEKKFEILGKWGIKPRYLLRDWPQPYGNVDQFFERRNKGGDQFYMFRATEDQKKEFNQIFEGIISDYYDKIKEKKPMLPKGGIEI